MIAPALLIHSAKAYTIEGMNADRKPIYDEGIDISHVRISLKKGFANGSNGLEVADNMTLFFDCTSSYPIGWKPVEKMKIEFKNETYTVKSVKASYGLSDTPEFYTAELV